jgi:uncharacterized membrane protein HdeD (DUF308 family)
MRTSGDIINPKWMRIFQIVVGIACIGISIYILIGSHELGAYSLIFLSSTVFIIIGIERIVVGIKSTFLKRSSRLISIGIGIGLVIYFGSAYFAPVFVSKLYVLMLGFGLLATGALRIIDSIKDNTYSKDSKIFILGTGALCVAVSIFIFSFPKVGFVILMLIVAIILLINGLQIAYVGITGKKITHLRV